MSVETRETGPEGARSTVRRLDVGRAVAATRVRTMNWRLPYNTTNRDIFSTLRQSHSRFGKAGDRGMCLHPIPHTNIEH